jgi:hypothetical protein
MQSFLQILINPLDDLLLIMHGYHGSKAGFVATAVHQYNKQSTHDKSAR